MLYFNLMGKKIILIIIAVLITGLIWYVFFNNPKSSPISPLSQGGEKPQPSKTVLEYVDPSGFSLSYPDNLSLEANKLDDSTYADLSLFSKDVNGSLKLKIIDSKFKTLDEWVKLNGKAGIGEVKEVELGNLKAMEIKTSDRLLLGSLDQGILFNIEIPLVEEEFWMKVYSEVLSNFTFVSLTTASTNSSAEDISFEGEEVVE